MADKPYGPGHPGWERNQRALLGEKSKEDEKTEQEQAGSSPAYQGSGPAGENMGESGVSRPAAEVLNEDEKK